MIKKTDIFNYQNTNEFKENFNFKGNNQLDFYFYDHYSEFKKNIVKEADLIS